MNVENPESIETPIPEVASVTPATPSVMSYVMELAWWKKMALSAAAVLMVAGLGVKALETNWSENGSSVQPQNSGNEIVIGEDKNKKKNNPNIKTTLLPGSTPGVEVENVPRNPDDPPPHDAQLTDGDLPISPAMIKGGLSFIVGFSVGFALRTFLKMSLFICGLIFLAIFGLSYAEFIEVKWDVMEESFNQTVASLEGEFKEFKSFITGTLPSAGLASVGLFAGFKRNR